MALVEQLDDLLAKYYASKNRSYQSEFSEYCEDNDFEDDDYVTMDLAEDVNDSQLVYFMVEYGKDFPCFEPLRDSDPYQHKKEQFLCLIRLLHQTNDVPSDQQLRVTRFQQFITWKHIPMCLQHEMYTAISTKMHEVIQENDSSLDMDDLSEDAVGKVIELLQNKRKLNNKEVQFIGNAVQRAREFKSEKAPLSIS